jgi:uncharacterized protein YbbC (DUF1343 family)
VGLIANSASVNEEGASTASLLLDAGIRLTCLFSPEHGYEAYAEAGQTVPDSINAGTGLPVHSLYGDTRQPTSEMLQDIDAIVFDMQDVGTRCYTYASTMALAMQSAALFGKLFVVLDRPNPLGGIAVQGPMLEPEFSSFVGMYPLPLRHGMTIGELALMFNKSFEIGANLAVIRMQGWRRRLWFADTGLKWRPPSPAIGSPECSLVYAGTCLFEGTNISEGRGTLSPFRLIGAPWLDPDIVNQVDARWFSGFAVTRQRFTPVSSKHAGTECVGFSIDVVDREQADPIALSTVLLAEIFVRHQSEFEWNELLFDAIAGTDKLRRRICAGIDEDAGGLENLFDRWQKSHMEFEKLRYQYLLYEG